jgi:hypothetical protein
MRVEVIDLGWLRGATLRGSCKAEWMVSLRSVNGSTKHGEFTLAMVPVFIRYNASEVFFIPTGLPAQSSQCHCQLSQDRSYRIGRQRMGCGASEVKIVYRIRLTTS